KIFQEGDNLRFSWKFPEFPDNNKTPLEISSIKKILIYYSDRPLSTDVPGNEKKKTSEIKSSSSLFLKKSRLLIKIDPRQLKSINGIYHFEYPKISGKFLNKKIYLAVNYKYQKIISELSEIKEIKIMEPMEPVTDLSLSNENKVIKLNWSVNSKKKKGKKSPVISGFNVFRKIDNIDQDTVPSFKKINTDKILKEYYEDSDTGVSGTYSYYVSVLATDLNISKPSNQVTLNVKDIFPPAVPQNLHIFKSNNGLMLSWKIIKDKDLSHYKLYRKEGNSSEFNILEAELKENRFLDKTVKKGKKYFYYITSVDNNGNESENSETGSEQF
ncbi:MAG: hypothetical protein ABFR36_08495, partial [Acidobacteriota bacterium]